MIIDSPDTEEVLVPLVEEHLVVSKEAVVTGRVTLKTHVETHRAHIQEALRREDVVVERVKIGRQVDAAPAVRHEDGVTIYPIVEEVLVVEKRLFLREELRVSVIVTTETVSQSVELRSVKADIERESTKFTPNSIPTLI